MITGIANAIYSSRLAQNLSTTTSSSTASTAASSTTSAQTKNTDASPSLPAVNDPRKLSIGQIRDITNKMAVDGKLSIHQQMALVAGGLMDPNPQDPNSQPAPGTRIGYSRGDIGTYDFVGLMQNATAAATSSGFPETAEIYSSIGQAFQDFYKPVDIKS